MTKQASEPLRSMALVLTSECNLRCAYCFQNAKGPGRMEWETLKAALDLALEHGRPRIKILFSGGEPLLEFELIQKALAYAERKLPAKKQILFTLITNGTLLTEEVVACLVRHSITAQISFDGVSTAQDWRAKDTFVSLDSLLDRLQSMHPDFYNSNVKISTTVIPQTVRYIADSFQYFLTRGARRIAIAPSIADTSGWKAERIEQLERQLARVCEMSLAHFERTGEVPLLFFRHTGEEASPDGQSRIESQHLCAAGRGEMLAVDVDGEVYPCITLAGSCQTITSSALRAHVEAMRLGSLTGRQFWDRYHRLSEVARGLGIFAPKDSRRSSYRRCRDCPYLAQCFVCPTSIGHVPAAKNCERVPDFTCAFNFTVLKYRERFLEQTQARR